MDGTHEVSGHLDDDGLADLDKVCAHLGLSREDAVTTAVLRFVGAELPVDPYFERIQRQHPYVETDLDAIRLNTALTAADSALGDMIARGEADIAAGRTFRHEDVMEELRRLDEDALAKKQAAA